MTKPKLRKKAEINPPQSPHDGIHTCSKGCKKPGCTRTLRDTIEEQDAQIEALKRDLLEKTAELRKKSMETIYDINQIGGLQEENARLKAEVEALKKPAIIGGYNISEYIRMANSETLEFDNGDLFATMTLPERIKYIVNAYEKISLIAHDESMSLAYLRSVAEDNKRETEATRIENARLKAEIEKLTFEPLSYLDDAGEWMPRHTHLAAVERLKAECQARQAENSVLAVECDSLKAEVERLTDCQSEADRLKAEVEAHEKRWAESEDLISHYKQQRDEAYNDCQCHRLKAEVERLDTLCKQLMAQHSDISCENIMLRKAGDAMAGSHITLIQVYLKDSSDEWHQELHNRWNAAKEGKPQP